MNTEQLIKELLNPKLGPDEETVIKVNKIQLPPHSHGALSPTQIDMYWRCPMQYWFRYGLGLRLPPGIALVEGGSHHEVFAADNNYKKKTGKNRPEKWLCQKFTDTFNTNQKEIPKSEWKAAGENKDDVIRRGVLVQRLYMKRIAPYVHPEFVEEKVKYGIGDVEVVGVIDVAGTLKPKPGERASTLVNGFLYDNAQVLKEPMIGAWDYKVVGRRKSEDDAINSIALSHYGWATIDLLKGIDLVKRPPRAGFISFTKDENPTCHVQTTLITAGRIRWYRRQVLSVADAISRGSFPVRSGIGWECSAKFCGYYSRCKGKVWKG